MKPGLLFKIILLALPVIMLIYVLLIRDRMDAGSGVGGGSYDLTKIYTLVIAGLYMLVLNLGLLIQDARGNRFFLLAGIVLLIGTVIITIRTF
jgi:hypothetical protein